jgi:hypothetical protein
MQQRATAEPGFAGQGQQRCREHRVDTVLRRGGGG